MARGRKKGSRNKAQLPTSYDVGDGVVNFYLAILARAKADVFQSPSAREMVESFAEYRGITLEEYLAQEGGNVDEETLGDVTGWVSEYIKERDVL